MISPPDPARFSFFAAEFQPLDRALAGAQGFVQEQLPPGLPIDQARVRLKRAAMPCPRAVTGAPFTCHLSMVVHIGGGQIGEDMWSVRLEPDDGGVLRSAVLDHRVIGTGPENPN